MDKNKSKATIKFIFCSLLGIFVFFVSVTINGSSSIMIDHITKWIRALIGPEVQKYCVLLVTAAGVVIPFITKIWNKSKKDMVFHVFRILGFVCACFFVFQIGPEDLITNPQLLPYLFTTLCCNLCFLIPIGTMFLSFLTKYGLMEFCSVFLQPVMRKIWKTPGRSALDALASYMGSYSVALTITDDLYQKGLYTTKEAYIVATGFSTVSASFLIVISNTLQLNEHWNLYFFSSLVITFIVTAIIVRLYPTRKVPNTYMEGITPKLEAEIKQNRLQTAWKEANRAAASSNGILKNMCLDFCSGLKMITTVIPSILSIGLIGVALVSYTPVFDYIGYLFYPFTLLVRIPEALQTARALSLSIVDMFLPASFVANASFAARYVVGVGCVSELLFFSAVIPCILSTKIPVKITDILIIWVERVIFSILLAGIVALIFL